MAHLEKLKTLSDIEKFSKRHSWAVSTEDKLKINGIQQEAQKNITKEQNSFHLLHQLTSILKEQNIL